jgi:beta-lactamase regulating signal transducer with metallopeptidase domain
VAQELSLNTPPETLVAPGRLPPFVVQSLRRARLVLPEALVEQLTEPQRRALLLHELTHLKHGDHRLRLLELAVRIAFWWLPLGTIGRQLRACEELCCDAAVVKRMPHARRDYAQLLLDVLDFADPVLETPAHAMGMSASQGMEARLHRILKRQNQSRWTAMLAGLTVLSACLLLPCGVHYELAASAAEVPTPSSLADGCNAAAASPHSLQFNHRERLTAFCCPRIEREP